MALPIFTNTGTVVGQYLVPRSDSADPDALPEYVAAQGTVRFTPTAGYFVNYQGDPNPYLSLRSTIVANLDAEGFIVDPESGSRGIVLPATDDPNFEPLNWTWEVVYDLSDADGKLIRTLPRQAFYLPTGATVDLVSNMPAPKSNGEFVLRGPIGPVGPQGQPGPRGIRGEKGSTGATGSQGPRGLQGEQGIPGQDSVVPGPIGPQGEIGPRGLTGTRGERGEMGPAGPTGPRGLPGEQGIQGPQGEASTVPGPAGPQGQQGPQGFRGERGETGPRGAQGIQGLTGETGATGQKGDKGDQGTGIQLAGTVANEADLLNVIDPVEGDAYVVENTGNLHIYSGTAFGPGTPFRGPEGRQGETGPRGLQGAQGIPGADSTVPGPKGDKGDPGEQGLPGADSTVPGPKGDPGEPGPQGLPGADSTVPGPKGDPGERGPQGLPGADSTVPGPKGDTGATGQTGAPGISAYQSAVNAGFVGSETEWRASLKGEKGDKGDKGEQGLPGTSAPVVNTPFAVRYNGTAWEFTTLAAAQTAGLNTAQTVVFYGPTGVTPPSWARTNDYWTEG